MGRRIKTEELDDYHLNISDAIADNQEEELQKLHWAIRQLTEIERAMIMMALDEVPYEEIAETIGITQNNVRVRMNRIREKIRNLIQ
jgi:RNA polymerase sigma-70 factor (ECF subfamily)